MVVGSALPCKFWIIDAMNDVMLTCINVHNMLMVDQWDENDAATSDYLVDDGFQVDELYYDPNTISHVMTAEVRKQYMSEVEHCRLCYNLVEQLWEFQGKQNE